MVVGKSPEWLPPGFTEKVKYKNGRKIKYYFNVATGMKYHSKKDVLRCATEDSGLLVTPQTKNGDDKGLTSDSKVDVVSVKTNDSPAWLPSGWIMEERTRQSGSSKGSVYKVYTDLSSGSKFYSKTAVTRYLNTVDHTNAVTEPNEIDNADKPNEDKPNVNEPSLDMSPQLVSMTNTGGIGKKRMKDNSFVTVTIESTTDDDLPLGWIKEIKTSKTGNKIRKDPYYTDPISGYIFRSKLDALRYLKTNDVGSCACRPLRRKSDNVKLTSSNLDDEKLPLHKSQNSLTGELDGGGESSGAKSLAESESKISKQKDGNPESESVKVTPVGANYLEEKNSCENSNNNALMENELKNDVSKGGTRAMAVDIAICSPVTDPLTKQQLSESRNRTKVDSRKSKKRKDSMLPLRTSKRIAGSQPEMQSNQDFDERSLRAAARRSSESEVDPTPSFTLTASASIPLPPDIEPTKDAAEETFIGKEIGQDINPQEVEKPPTEGPAIPEEQAGGKASEKQVDDGKRSQESQLCYDFGDSWSDPLEFALKTLRGEISLEDTLAFPGCFNEQISTPYNQVDGCLRQPQSDPPTIFQNEFASRSESSKQHSAVDQVPANSSSFSTVGNIGFASFGGFNPQSSTEVGKGSQTNFNP